MLRIIEAGWQPRKEVIPGTCHQHIISVMKSILIHVGFEDIIRVHFAIQRDAVLRQCSTWLREAGSPEHERRLRKAIDELRAELDKL